ncbi:MAG: hypothetical protein Tsb0014_38140 [Pleurocapsa sp.]
MFNIKDNFLPKQLVRIYPVVLLIYLPTILVLLLIGFISWQTDIPIMDFTRDPLSIVDAPVYLGFLSNIGILFWAAGATICFFAAAIINQIKHKTINFYFLLFAGVITTILLIDDFFLLHEEVFPKYFDLAESQAFLIYLLLVLAYLVFFRNKIASTDFLLLGLSLFSFASSAIADEIFVAHFRGKFLIEDGCKLLGILTWTAYFTRVAMTEIIKNCQFNLES